MLSQCKKRNLIIGRYLFVMKKFNLLLTLLMICALNVHASSSKNKADADTKQWRYEIECEGNGSQGTYLVKVWSYSKKQATAANQAVKNAVHGVIFKGVAGGGGCASQKPLASSPGVQYDYADFFDRFFAEGGEYAKYASVVGVPEYIKIGKEYKAGVVVSVAKDQLRKDLESAGIIKSLSSGF